MTQEKLLTLFDAYHDMVYRLALTATHSVHDAEDVTQTVFCKLLDGCPPPQEGKERAWLATVTVNTSRDLLRAARRRQTEPLDESIPFSQPEEAELFDAVMSLPQVYRVVIHLHYYEGYRISEIAELCHMKPSAVSMRLTRARKLLRSKLKEDEL